MLFQRAFPEGDGCGLTEISTQFSFMVPDPFPIPEDWMTVESLGNIQSTAGWLENACSSKEDLQEVITKIFGFGSPRVG